jgi:lysophospholipid acyltransferase (LPLAT)-like uncharacterized protein
MLVIKILSVLLYFITRMLAFTYRYEFRNKELHDQSRSDSGKNAVILAVWHQNILAAIISSLHNDYPHSVMISKSKDGELVAFMVKMFGNIPVRGSSRSSGRDKGGLAARDQMIQKLNEGVVAAVSIDGPKGPIYKVKPGVIDMSRKSGCPIIPFNVIPEKFWTLCKTWDQFRIPKPFTKIAIVYGEPILVSKDKDNLFYQEKIHTALKNGEEKIKISFGQ